MKKEMRYNELPAGCHDYALEQYRRHLRWEAREFNGWTDFEPEINPIELNSCLWDDHLRLVAC